MPVLNSEIATSSALGTHVFGWVAVALSVPLFILFCYLLFAVKDKKRSIISLPVVYQVTGGSLPHSQWFADPRIQLRVEKEPDCTKLRKAPWLTRLFRRRQEHLLPTHSGPSASFVRSFSDCSRLPFVQPSFLPKAPASAVTSTKAETVRLTSSFPHPSSKRYAVKHRVMAVDPLVKALSPPPIMNPAKSELPVDTVPPVQRNPIAEISNLFGTSELEPLIKELEDYASLVKALPPPIMNTAKSELPVDTVPLAQKDSIAEISDLFGTSELEPLIKELEDYASLVKTLPPPAIFAAKLDLPVVGMVPVSKVMGTRSTGAGTQARAIKPPCKQVSPTHVVTKTKATAKILQKPSSVQKNVMKENDRGSQSSRPSRISVKHPASVGKPAIAVSSTPPSALSSVPTSPRVPLSRTPPSSVAMGVRTHARPPCRPTGSPSAGSKAVTPTGAPSRLPRTSGAKSRLRTATVPTAASVKATVLDAQPVPFLHLAFKATDRTPKWTPMEEAIVQPVEKLLVEELYPPLRRNFQFPPLYPPIVETVSTDSTNEDLDRIPIRGYDWWYSQLELQR